MDLVTGGCGFVGKNMVKRLIKLNQRPIVIIDNLLFGHHPDEWIPLENNSTSDVVSIYGNSQVYFIHEDIRVIFRGLLKSPNFLEQEYGIPAQSFSDVFHFAAIVGGRAKIDGDPMTVAQDLAIDAACFDWVCKQKPNRLLYPSSSAAYPINLQTEADAIALKESDIDFSNMGQPDMTYGWCKLTGEYLAHIAATYYDVKVTCIRPFSGYGEDQDLSYPVPAIARRAANQEDPFEVWGTGHQGRDFVHIDDVIDCILLAMDHIHDGSAINIGQGKLTSFIDLIDLFTDFANYNPKIKQLLDKPVGVHSRYADMSYVKQKLNWEPKISIREGMKRVYDAQVKRLQEEQ